MGFGGTGRKRKGLCTKQCAWRKHGSSDTRLAEACPPKLRNTVKYRIEEMRPKLSFWKHRAPKMRLVEAQCAHRNPEGPARHLDASRQKLTPHCLAAIFDSQLPSPKLSPKMPPKLPLPTIEDIFFLFQNCPRGEGNCAAIERQKVSRGNFCLAASICLSGPSGKHCFPEIPLGSHPNSRVSQKRTAPPSTGGV